MGCYVNPAGETKEAWLEREAEEVEYAPATLPADGRLSVCLVHNRDFTAAGVAYDQHELEAFQMPIDPRPKRWFVVDKEKLKKVSPLDDYLPAN